MEEEIVRDIRYKRSLSLAILDIDFLKNINDTFGHDIGDDIIKKLYMKLDVRLGKQIPFADWVVMNLPLYSLKQIWRKQRELEKISAKESLKILY
jgi:diguanylate cyclase with GGDEF domain